jgi:hypothetical protein
VLQGLLSGQYVYPVRIVCFNAIEGWSRDATSDVADALAEQSVSCLSNRLVALALMKPSKAAEQSSSLSTAAKGRAWQPGIRSSRRCALSRTEHQPLELAGHCGTERAADVSARFSGRLATQSSADALAPIGRP